MNAPIIHKLLNILSMGPPKDITQLVQRIPLELMNLLYEAARYVIALPPYSFYRSAIFQYAIQSYVLYENMHFKGKISIIIDVLSRENLVEPIQQTEICGRRDCMFVRISIPADPAVKREYYCPRCGSRLMVIKLYVIDPLLSKLKLEGNVDLPIFIREYLRFRSFDNMKVYGPCTHNNDEFDVIIPDKKVGIECKLFEKVILTEHDVRSYAGKLRNDLEKYWNISLNEIILVTNLETRSAKMLEDELQQQVPSGKSVRVIHGDADALIATLDVLLT